MKYEDFVPLFPFAAPITQTSRNMSITSLDQLDLSGTYTYADYLRWQFNERVELPARQNQANGCSFHETPTDSHSVDAEHR
jgi:hypothetical protein